MYTKSILAEMHEKGMYREVIIEVDSRFGWKEGELNTEYTKEQSEWCLKQI
ncbi:hypothetical protein ABEY43_06750 [Priestia megaterium]